MIHFISVLSVVISLFSLLIFLIWFFSLFFLMRLANGLSILFIFLKNHVLVLLIFALVSFVYFSFISALILMISFLLILRFFISSFSSYFSCEVGYLFDFFLISWGKHVLLWTFPLALFFNESHRVWVVVFQFHLFLCILISFFISSMICWLFRSMLFSLHMFVFLIDFSL